RLRPLQHHGEAFEVAGPLNVPTPPQGRPVLFQSGASEPGRELAARHAEGIYAVAWDLDSARAYRSDIRARAAARGRVPEAVAVAWPLSVPPPPQGRPVRFQAGASEPGRELAARHAEGIYAVAWDLDSARAYRSDIRARAAARGRDPEAIAVMPGLVAHVASSEEEARRVRADLDSRLPVADSLRQLSFFIGQDASDWELDAPVPP